MKRNGLLAHVKLGPDRDREAAVPGHGPPGTVGHVRRWRAVVLVLGVGALCSGGLLLSSPAHHPAAPVAVTTVRTPGVPLMACQQTTHCPAGGMTTGAVLAGVGLLAMLALLASVLPGRRRWRRRGAADALRPGVRHPLLRPPQLLAAV